MAKRTVRARSVYAWVTEDRVIGRALTLNVTGASGGEVEVIIPMTDQAAVELSWGVGKILEDLDERLETTKRYVAENISQEG